MQIFFVLLLAAGEILIDSSASSSKKSHQKTESQRAALNKIRQILQEAIAELDVLSKNGTVPSGGGAGQGQVRRMNNYVDGNPFNDQTTVDDNGGSDDVDDDRMPSKRQKCPHVSSIFKVLKNLYSPKEEIVRFRGYPIERHNVQTLDGYILSIFRIPSGKKEPNPRDQPKEPILVQHGFLATAYNWILNNEDQALAYVLADNGYDVWLGNIRGNSFSKKHVNYTVLDPEFWDFTWVEMAEYDLPAMIDYILNRTYRSQLIYLGYSQGSLMGFAKFSSDPIYADKVKTFIAMAPVATVGDILSPAKQLARFTWTLKVGFVVGGYRSFGVLKLILKDIQQSLVNDNRGKNKTCDHLYFNFINPDARANLNETLIPLYLSRMPDDTSLKNVAHYGQMISSGLMQKYDYGLLKNYLIYGQLRPPLYHPENMNVSTVIFWSSEDKVAGGGDVKKLFQKLRNFRSYKIENFRHIDFSFSYKAADLVYKKILQVLNE